MSRYSDAFKRNEHTSRNLTGLDRALETFERVADPDKVAEIVESVDTDTPKFMSLTNRGRKYKAAFAGNTTGLFSEVYDAWSTNQGKALDSLKTLTTQIDLALIDSFNRGNRDPSFIQVRSLWSPLKADFDNYYTTTQEYFNPDGTFKWNSWNSGGATQVNEELKKWANKIEPFRKWLVDSAIAPTLQPQLPPNPNKPISLPDMSVGVKVTIGGLIAGVIGLIFYNATKKRD